MSKIGDISKKYKTEVENAKSSDFDSRYGIHYNSVMIPHLRQLDDTFNKCVTEMKLKLESEKSSYIAEQKEKVKSEVEAEYTTFLSTIQSFIDKEG